MEKFKETHSLYLAAAVLGATLIALMTAVPAGAQVLLRVPDDSPGAPIYARTDLHNGLFTYHTDEWAAIVFYRLPECVPDDFNLLAFFDAPGAFTCALTVSGFELWDNGPSTDAAPRQAVSTGLAVPIWFVPWPALEAAIADGVLTMPQLESLEPLAGIAAQFHELLHPAGGPAKIPHLTITAHGVLVDGTSFQYQFNSVETNKPKDNVKIVFR